ncbi:potassium transporter [Bacteroidia bacterium]|nr:potassium transporter [Bacteroidia bacterium]
MQIHWRLVLKVVGFMLLLESLFMFLATAVSDFYHEQETQDLLIAAGITLASGCAMVFLSGSRKKMTLIGKKESYLCVALTWTLFALFGALPFFITGSTPLFVDAFFESMSGITTTGSSILTDVDTMPKGILFWRSSQQWLGGIGIVVFSLALLPLLGGGAAQLFDAESSGLTHDKFRPRVTQMAKRIWGIYLGLTVLLVLLLGFGPMGWFDAVCHSLSTVSTGGFSTKSASIGYWDSGYIEWCIIVFMFIGALNLPLLYLGLVKGKFNKMFKDTELRWFVAVIVLSVLTITVSLCFDQTYAWQVAFRQAGFHVVSFITTTGFTIANFSVWGSFYLVVFLILMIICGCAGSTSGGLKMIRAVVLIKNIFREFERLAHPRAIIPVRVNDQALTFRVVQRLLAFAFLYLIIIVISWGILTVSGISFSDALSSAISTIGNAGPGFGAQFASYEFISDFAKWYLCFLMLVGRLELFTILILFTPSFWKR